MVTRNVDVLIGGSSAGLEGALARSSAAADETSAAIGTKFDEASTKAGGAFEKLGNTLSNWGLPFGGAISDIGKKFDDADTKGQKFGQAMSTLGGAALLGVGAGFLAVGAESIEMADKYEAAASTMDTAIKNNGGNLETLKPKIDAAYSSMSSLGFNSTDTAQAIAQLTTSTGSPTKAISLLGEAADLAHFKNISLADASSLLGKVMAGSNRVVTQLGLNLDIGTGKLATIKTASEALTTAQLKLKQTNEEIAAGVIKAGVPAEVALENAHRAVSLASEKLTKDQGAVGDVLDAIKGKTQGAATAYGQTLAGQMEVARAKLHNLGTDFGEFLVPKIEEAGKAVAGIITWFEKHKAVAESLAAVIGAVLGAAMLKFAVETAGKMVGGAKDMATSLLHLGDTFKGAAGSADIQTTSTDELDSKLKLAVDRITSASVQLQTLTDHEAAADDTTTTLTASSEALAAAWDAVGEASDAVVEGMGEIEAAGPEVDASFEATGEAADSAFGPIGIAIMAVVAVGTLLVTHWKQVEQVAEAIWHDIDSVARTVWGALEDFFKKWGEDLLLVFAPVVGIPLFLATHWQEVEDDAKAIWGDIVSFFTGIPGDIMSALSSLGSDIEGVAKTAWDDFTTAVKTGWDNEVSFWTGLPGKILSALGDAGTWLLDVGKNIMEGLLKGIENGEQDVINGIKQVGSDVLNAAKSVLKIFSPSHVFADIGGNLMEGLAVGISSTAGLPKAAVSAATSGLGLSVPTAYSAGINGSSGAQPVGGSSSSSSSHISIVNQITGVPINDANAIASEVGYALRVAMGGVTA